MRYLKGIELTNIVSYEQAYFPLDRRGLTVVYGQNKDSSKDDLKSNGAGKSLLVTMLAETLVDQNPLVEGRHTVKDAFYRKGAASAVDFDDYRLEKRLEGRTLKYDMFKLNKAGEWAQTKVRTNDYVWKKMASVFPIRNDEFFSLYYIDSSRGSILQRGSHTDRLKLFSSLFNLEKYDIVLAEIKARLKELKKADIRMGEVLDQIAVHERDINEDIEADVERLTELQEQQRSLSRKRSEAQVLLNQATVYNAHHPTIEYLEEALPDLMPGNKKLAKDADFLNREFMGEYVDALADGIKALKRKVETARDAEKARLKLDDSRTRVKDLTRKVGKWTPEKVAVELKAAKARDAEVEKEEARRVEIEAEIKKLRKAVTKPADAAKAVEYLNGCQGADPDDIRDTLRQGVAECVSSMRRAKSDLSEFDQAFKKDACECPTCHSSLSKEAIKSIRESLAHKLETAKTALALEEELETRIATYLKYHETKRRVGELDQELVDLGNSAMQRENHDDTPAADFLRGIKAALEQLAEEQERLDDLEEKAGGASDEPLEELQERLAQYRTCLEKASAVKPFLKALREATENEAGEYDVEGLEAGLAKVDKKLTALMKEIPKLAQSVSVAKSAMEKLNALNEKRDTMASELEDMPVLKALEDAWGQKGLKNLTIKRACDVIESNLNAHAPLLFSEKIKFSIEVDETHLHILATRTLNGETSTVDVRRLSGAESRSFNLLVPMAVLPMVPANRRLNILALDEPTNNMDPPAIEMFSDKYLPKLLELVPHVIVLSPNKLPIDIADAEYWKVTREGGISTLQKQGE